MQSMYRLGRKVMAGGLFCLVLVGCASAPPELTKEARNDLSQVETLVVVPQEKIGVTYRPVAAGPGLFGAVIAIAMNVHEEGVAREKAAPLVAKLQDYDFRKTLQDAVQDRIRQGERLGHVKVPVTFSDIATDAQKMDFLKHAEGDAVLFFSVAYYLISGDLEINAEASLYPRSEGMKKHLKAANKEEVLAKTNQLYRKNFSFLVKQVTEEDIEAKLQEGAASIVDELAKSLEKEAVRCETCPAEPEPQAVSAAF